MFYDTYDREERKEKYFVTNSMCVRYETGKTEKSYQGTGWAEMF